MWVSKPLINAVSEPVSLPDPDLVRYLAAVPDPRRPRGVRHSLMSLLMTSVAAVMAAARSFTAIGEWAADAPPQVLAALGIRRDPLTGRFEPPYQATIRRMLEAVDADAPDATVGSWLAARAGSHAAFMRGERAAALERTGHWDEAVALGTKLLASSDLSPLYRLRALQVLGIIRVRRGEPGAWEYLDEAAAGVDASGEPQWIIVVRLARAEAYWLQGDPHRAAQEAERADDVAAGSGRWERGEIGAWLRTSANDAVRADRPFGHRGGDPARGRIAARNGGSMPL
jgi:hypothetical protein